MADASASPSSGNSNVLGAAFGVSITGGLILASTFVATVPTIVVTAGWLLFVLGTSVPMWGRTSY